MAIKIQVNGETVYEIEGKVREIKIRGSRGGVGVVDGEGLKRLNIIPEMMTDFNNPLELIEEKKSEPVESMAPVEKSKIEVMSPSSTQLTIDSTGTEVDENLDNPGHASI